MPAAHVVTTLHRATDGNPLFVGAVIAGVRADGALPVSPVSPSLSRTSLRSRYCAASAFDVASAKRYCRNRLRMLADSIGAASMASSIARAFAAWPVSR